MSTAIGVILEIIKITVPALIVFFTVQTLLKEYLDKQYKLKQLDYQQKKQDGTLPLRLQAYERLSLFCERISIPNLVLRLRTEEMQVADLKVAMLIAIQQEYEHNISQQIYISDQLWQILQLSRDEIVYMISNTAASLPADANANELAKRLFQLIGESESNILSKAQLAIKKEVSTLF